MAFIKLPVIVKDKNINTAIYVGIAVLLVFLIYKNLAKIKSFVLGGTDDSELPNDTPSNASNSETPKPTPPALTNNSVLKRGVRGDRVQWLQYYFNTKVHPLFIDDTQRLEEDGIFGEKTETAVRRVTGKTQTTWTEFKAKVDTLKIL